MDTTTNSFPEKRVITGRVVSIVVAPPEHERASITKWNGDGVTEIPLPDAKLIAANNHTKSNPCIQAGLMRPARKKIRMGENWPVCAKTGLWNIQARFLYFRVNIIGKTKSAYFKIKSLQGLLPVVYLKGHSIYSLLQFVVSSKNSSNGISACIGASNRIIV